MEQIAAYSTLLIFVLGGIGWLVKRRFFEDPAERRKADRADIYVVLEKLEKQVEKVEKKNEQLEVDLIAERERTEKMEERIQFFEAVLPRVEQEIVDALDEVNVARWEVDRENKIIRANLAFVDLTGWEVDSLCGRVWHEIICTADAPMVKRRFTIFKNNRDTTCEIKFRIQHCSKKTADGEPHQTQVKIRVRTICGIGDNIYKITAQTAPLNLN